MKSPPLISRAFTLLELLLTVAVITVLLMLCLPVFSMLRERAKAAGCKVNLRVTAATVYLYAGDYNGYFPPGWNGVLSRPWPIYLEPYTGGAVSNLKIKGKKVFTGPFYCPSTSMEGEGIYERDQNQWRTDFGANQDLFDFPPTRAGSQGGLSPKTVMFYDGSGVKRNPPALVKQRPRHGGQSHIVFLDGHVEPHRDFPTASLYWKGK